MTHYLRLLLSIPLMVVALTQSFGQKSEINIAAYGGLSFFRGNGSANTSWMGRGPDGSSTSHPYSKKPHFFYSFEVSGQQVTQGRFIYGLGLAFEALKSSIDIDSAAESAFIFRKYATTGQSTFKSTFITLNPYIGHRMAVGKVLLDLTGGMDVAFTLKGHITGDAVSTDKNFHISVDYKTKSLVDLRPRVQARIQYEKVGLSLGYSMGLTAYKNEWKTNSYTNIVRLGLTYCLL